MHMYIHTRVCVRALGICLTHARRVLDCAYTPALAAAMALDAAMAMAASLALGR